MRVNEEEGKSLELLAIQFEAFRKKSGRKKVTYSSDLKNHAVGFLARGKSPRLVANRLGIALVTLRGWAASKTEATSQELSTENFIPLVEDSPPATTQAAKEKIPVNPEPEVKVAVTRVSFSCASSQLEGLVYRLLIGEASL